MNFERMQELQERVFDRVRKILDTKVLEYASEEDTLADFKEVAEEAGVTPFQVWLTYVKKHERAIDTFIREGAVKSESIEDRILDTIVYHLLLLGLVEDHWHGHIQAENARPPIMARDVSDPEPIRSLGGPATPEGEGVTFPPKPTPYDILRRWMGSQISPQTLTAIRAEFRSLGFEGDVRLEGSRLSYVEPSEDKGITLPASATAVWEGTDD